MNSSKDDQQLFSRHILPAICGLFIILSMVCVQGHAEIYKWVDSNGKIHFESQAPLNNPSMAPVKKNESRIRQKEIEDLIPGKWLMIPGKLNTYLEVDPDGKFEGYVIDVYNKKRHKSAGIWTLKDRLISWTYWEGTEDTTILGKTFKSTIIELDKYKLKMLSDDDVYTEYQRDDPDNR